MKLLKNVVEQGEAISQVARLSNDDLLALLRLDSDDRQLRRATPREDNEPAKTTEFLLRAEKAINDFDITALESILLDAEVKLSRPLLLNRFLAPLLQRIGEKWQQGAMRIAQEHLATAAIHTFLGRVLATQTYNISSPWVVVGTPVGQAHELGAYLAALTAASFGWNVAYLGADLPAEEIAVALRKYDSLVACLSIVYPADDARLTLELRRLKQLVGDDLHIIIGGRSAASYQEQLADIGVTVTNDLDELGAQLDRLRKSHMAAGISEGDRTGTSE